MTKRLNIWWLLVAAGCLAAGASLLGVLLAEASFDGREVVLVLDGALLGFGLPWVIRELVVPSVRKVKDSPPAEAAPPTEEAERARLEMKARAASEAGVRQAVQKLTDENRALRSQLGELAQPHLARYGALARFGFDLATLYVAGGPAASPPGAVNDLLRLAEGLGLSEVVSAQIDHDLHAPTPPATAPGEPVRRVFRELLAGLPESADTRYRAAIEAGRWLSTATLCATRNTRPDESLRRELAADLRRVYVESEVAETTARVLLQLERGALPGPQALPWLALLKHYLEERAAKPEATPPVLEFAAAGPFADAARAADELSRCADLVSLYSPTDAGLMRQALGGG